MTTSAPKTPDLDGMRRAVAQFLAAAGHPHGEDPLLAETPDLVARAWAGEFLDGDGRDPLDALGEGIPVTRGEAAALVALDAVHFVGVCPHHLLPYRGTARIAYTPGTKLAGFGAIVQLIDALAHRLVLQEVLAQRIADALRAGLSAEAVFVRLEAAQSCLALRGENRPGAQAICEAFSGDEGRRDGLRSALR